MKKSTAAVATTLLLGLGADSAQAVDPFLVGSDTLGPIMDYWIGPSGFNWSPAVNSYSYQGSGQGEDAIENRDQELGPMSRFLTDNATATGCNHPTAVSSFAGCWDIAVDALAVYGNASQACSAFTWGADPALPNGGAGNFGDWRTVLRIVYAGEAGDPTVPMTTPSAPIATRCNSAARQTLVNNWDNLFRGACPTGQCAGGLKHAFRRDDNSGTTAVFLELLNLPPIGTSPFCNGNEQQDADPIRRACTGNGAPSTVPGGTGGETVCGIGPNANRGTQPIPMGTGDLGLVVPVLIPPRPANAPANWSHYAGNTATETTSCSSVAFGGAGGGAFGRVDWEISDILRYGQRCPNGQPPSFGKCFWPKVPGTSGDAGPGATGFGCIAAVNSRPPGSPSNFDARVYNLWARNADGSKKTYVRNNQPQPQIASFYRYRQLSCREEDETGSQGCFAANDACVIGFGGRSAIDEFGVAGIGLRSKTAPFEDTFPTVEDVTTYPLSRPLYLCELRPTPADQAPSDPEVYLTGVNGPVSDDFVAAQLELRDALRNNDPVIAAAAESAGFFSVPAPTKRCCDGTYNAATDTCE